MLKSLQANLSVFALGQHFLAIKNLNTSENFGSMPNISKKFIKEKTILVSN